MDENESSTAQLCERIMHFEDQDLGSVFLFGLTRHNDCPQQLVEIVSMIRWHEKRLFKFLMAMDTKINSKRLKKPALKPYRSRT
jgi:hypothetical protein